MIIGIAGKKGNGKTFTAELLANEFNYVQKRALATPVKHMAQYVYGLTEKEMYDPIVKEVKLDRYPFLSPRVIMQKLGTDVARLIDANTWVEFLKRNVDLGNCTVIEDIRFPEELQMCDYTIYVQGEFEEVSTDTHSSENSIKPEDCDRIITNTKREEDLPLFKEELFKAYNTARTRKQNKEEEEIKEKLTKEYKGK